MLHDADGIPIQQAGDAGVFEDPVEINLDADRALGARRSARIDRHGDSVASVPNGPIRRLGVKQRWNNKE